MRIITRELGVSEKGIRIVVNRLNQKSTVGVNDIREALKEPLTVQNDFKRVSESVNLGAPIYELYPRSAVARAVSSLADMLREGSGQTRRSIFGTTLSHLFGR
jgi:pilus assembly protein CpaE